MKKTPQASHSLNDTKQVGIWIRVSTEDQVRGESPETHEKRARLYAEAKGWNVVNVYRLDAISGKTVKDTPEAKRMLADVKDGAITGLIFSKLARLARNTKELLEFSELFRECGADLISLAESIDTSTPAGRLFYTMIAAMAQWEREEIAERVAASVPVRAKMGKILGGAPPFGYKREEGKIALDPTEAPVRKLLFELFITHRRKKVVARMLNEHGYRTRSGKLFSDTAIERLIRDPIAKGTRRANYTQNDPAKGDGAWILKPESDWVFHDAPAIVSPELWEECNNHLDTQRDRLKRPTKPVAHLFSGITYCACGTKMYVRSTSPKYICQTCRNKMGLDDLEVVFEEQIKHFLFSDAEVAAELSKMDDTIREKTELLGALEADAAKLAGEVDKLYDLYQSGMIDKAGFGAKYHPLSERRGQLETQIPVVQAEIDVLKISHLTQETAVAEARDLHSKWKNLSFEDKRRIVEAITERITIGDGEVEIHLYYTPPSSRSSGGSSSSSNQGGGTPPPSESPSGNRSKSATKLSTFVLPASDKWPST